MSNFIGIRHEDKYKLERRAPLTPKHVARLVKQKKLDIIVQTSDKRIFTDEEYVLAGAKIAKDLKKCSVIFGVKEMPESFFEAQKTYVFFSHVVKGQPYNMPMLRRMMELKCNLIEYEKVVDEQGKRLIFFGRYAGIMLSQRRPMAASAAAAHGFNQARSLCGRAAETERADQENDRPRPYDCRHDQHRHDRIEDKHN